MGKMKDIVIELGLTPEQCKDKEISKFALQVGYRKQTGDWYQYWDGKIKNFIAKFIVRRTYYDKFKTKIITT